MKRAAFFYDVTDMYAADTQVAPVYTQPIMAEVRVAIIICWRTYAISNFRFFVAFLQNFTTQLASGDLRARDDFWSVSLILKKKNLWILRTGYMRMLDTFRFTRSCDLISTLNKFFWKIVIFKRHYFISYFCNYILLFMFVFIFS